MKVFDAKWRILGGGERLYKRLVTNQTFDIGILKEVNQGNLSDVPVGAGMSRLFGPVFMGVLIAGVAGVRMSIMIPRRRKSPEQIVRLLGQAD